MQLKRTIKSGFTVVELMVVVVIIAVLAAIVVVGYGKWQESIAKKAVQSDLRMAASAMENKKNFSEGYPSSLPSTFKQGDSTNVSYAWGNLRTYCLNAVSKRMSSIAYYIDSTQGKNTLRQGICGANPSNPPSAPRLYAASPAAYRELVVGLIISWLPPANSGASAVTSYKIRVVLSGSCSGSDVIYELDPATAGESSSFTNDGTYFSYVTWQPIGACYPSDTPGLISRVYVSAQNSDGYGPELELPVSEDWL